MFSHKMNFLITSAYVNECWATDGRHKDSAVFLPQETVSWWIEKMWYQLLFNQPDFQACYKLGIVYMDIFEDRQPLYFW